MGAGNIRLGPRPKGAREAEDQGADPGNKQESFNPLIKAEGRSMRSMFSRMGKEEDPIWSAWNPAA
jgi:hypothetical protein